MDLRQAGAVVFGGASGLGAATARRLGAAGAEVVVADIAEDRGAVVAAESGGRWVRADVTDPDQAQEAVDAAAQAERGLRISVCCAGIGPAAKLVGRDGAAPLEVFRRVIEVNLLGTINVLRLAAAAMVTTSLTRTARAAFASTPPRSRPTTVRSGVPIPRRRRRGRAALPPLGTSRKTESRTSQWGRAFSHRRCWRRCATRSEWPSSAPSRSRPGSVRPRSSPAW
jgi:NAD(P)-dependent dehydrogenase (short-subunit alcohol dehydrogenase family)